MEQLWGFFGQQSQFLIDKPSITFLIAFHTCFLYEAYLNSIQATDVVVLCIKYQKIMSDCKVQIAFGDNYGTLFYYCI